MLRVCIMLVGVELGMKRRVVGRNEELEKMKFG